MSISQYITGDAKRNTLLAQKVVLLCFIGFRRVLPDRKS